MRHSYTFITLLFCSVILTKGKTMFMILNQSYVQILDGSRATLVDICGNDAIVELEQGKMLKITIDNFKTLFQLNFCA